VDGRFAAERVLLGALRDALLASEVYVLYLGRGSCLYCQSAGVRKGAPSSKMRISILHYNGIFAVWRGVEHGLVFYHLDQMILKESIDPGFG